MASLNDKQASVLRSLFGSAPDSAVRDLERALSEESTSDGPMSAVYRLVAKEALERRAKLAVFEPMLALCRPDGFPPMVLRPLWSGLRSIAGADVDAAASYASQTRISDEDLAKAVEIYDRLCLTAAAALREGHSAFAEAGAILAANRPDGVETFAQHLDLVPLVRGALARLPEWMGRLTEERSAAVRVVYKDAVNLADDAGPRFVSMLAANLPESWLIMRILSAIMDHPAERYLAVSELAPFAERVLDDIDDRLAEFRAFEPEGGRAAGLSAAKAIDTASAEIVEFEACVELNRESAWGKRIVQQRQTLAQMAEVRLAQIDRALEAAMPLQMVKFGKGMRGYPKLNEDPNPAALRRAEAFMAFFDHSRHCAGPSGFASARAKTAERIEARLDQYVEDLLEMMRTAEPDVLERVKVYLEVAAGMMESARDEKAGQIVRRRAAAA